VIYKVNVTITANSDLLEIVAYFFDKNREYSEKVYTSIKEKIKSLEDLPERGIVVPELENKGIRKFRQILSGNYRIIYSMENETIYINSIVDSRRNLEELLVEKLHNEIRRTTGSSWLTGIPHSLAGGKSLTILKAKLMLRKLITPSEKL